MMRHNFSAFFFALGHDTVIIEVWKMSTIITQDQLYWCRPDWVGEGLKIGVLQDGGSIEVVRLLLKA